MPDGATGADAATTGAGAGAATTGAGAATTGADAATAGAGATTTGADAGTVGVGVGVGVGVDVDVDFGATLAAAGFSVAIDTVGTGIDGVDTEGAFAIAGKAATANGAISAPVPDTGLFSFFCCGTPGLIWISMT